MKKRARLGFLVVILASLVLAQAPAPLPEAVVKSAKDKAEAVSLTGQRRPLKTGDRVYAGEVVETDAAGSAKLVLADGSELVISSLSRVQLNDSRANPQGQSSIAVYAGKIWSKVVGQSSQGFQVETSTAVVGIRGTEFSVGVALDGAARVGVNQGTVAVIQDAAQTPVAAARSLDLSLDGKTSPGAFKDDQRSWQKFQDDGARSLRQRPEELVGRMQAGLKTAQDNAIAARGAMEQRHEQYKTVRAEIEARTRVVVSPEDKKKAGQEAAAVLSEARKAQLAANRVRANAELVRAAARDAKSHPAAYPGAQGQAVLNAEAEVARLNPDQFQAQVLDEVARISDELERDIMRLDFAPELERKSTREKNERIEKETTQGLEPPPDKTPETVPVPPDQRGADLPPELEPPVQPEPQPEPPPEQPHPPMEPWQQPP